jgi:hypothetical protein
VCFFHSNLKTSLSKFLSCIPKNYTFFLDFLKSFILFSSYPGRDIRKLTSELGCIIADYKSYGEDYVMKKYYYNIKSDKSQINISNDNSKIKAIQNLDNRVLDGININKDSNK